MKRVCLSLYATLIELKQRTHTNDSGQQQLVDVECGWVGQVEDEREAEAVRTLVQVLII